MPILTGSAASSRVTFEDGSTDSKASLAEGGSLALLLLDDNPDQVPPGAFYDIRPAGLEHLV